MSRFNKMRRVRIVLIENSVNWIIFRENIINSGSSMEKFYTDLDRVNNRDDIDKLIYKYI